MSRNNDRMPPFQSHSETSRAAASEFRGKAVPLRLQVEDFVWKRECLGATDDELIDRFRMSYGANSIRPRRVEMSDPKYGYGAPIIDSGRKRRTRARKDAVVWIHVDHANRCQDCASMAGYGTQMILPINPQGAS